MIYKLCQPAKNSTESKAALILREDGSVSCFPFSEANTDYQAYLAWLDEGNTPEPAEVIE